jgi:serine protease Do
MREAKPMPMPTPPGDKVVPESRSERLGASVRLLTPEVARDLGVQAKRGALVTEVESGSAAERAGLRPGDVIVGYDGRAVHGPEELAALVAKTSPGRSVDVSVVRAGARRPVRVTLGKLTR